VNRVAVQRLLVLLDEDLVIPLPVLISAPGFSAWFPTMLNPRHRPAGQAPVTHPDRKIKIN
jgi:hypothetical protein